LSWSRLSQEGVGSEGVGSECEVGLVGMECEREKHMTPRRRQAEQKTSKSRGTRWRLLRRRSEERIALRRSLFSRRGGRSGRARPASHLSRGCWRWTSQSPSSLASARLRSSLSNRSYTRVRRRDRDREVNRTTESPQVALSSEGQCDHWRSVYRSVRSSQSSLLSTRNIFQRCLSIV
jgi:hypothetical protein